METIHVRVITMHAPTPDYSTFTNNGQPNRRRRHHLSILAVTIPATLTVPSWPDDSSPSDRTSSEPSLSSPSPSCVAGFIVFVLNQFQDQLVFYVTPTDAMEKYSTNPTKNKFRLGGFVLEGSVAEQVGSPEMEFVITDLITDILVRYQGSFPDLFREGHSVVVEGFVKPITDEIKKEASSNSVSQKARSGECYFSATEVLAKHDEKYMPKDVAAAIERNKKLLEARESTVATEAKRF